ncbi:MAG: SH3 domain-containing protein [Saprospiraceae bacterium]|nr:SH3 domain-containing protein [Saprospiraceae bacterium]
MKKLFSLFYFMLILFSIISAQSKEQYIVNTQTLNVRSGEGTDYNIVGTISKDDVVMLLEKNESGWWYIQVRELKGYVVYKYLKVDPYVGWDETNYKSGTSPECENITSKYDYNIDNYLKVSVGSNADVVVKLMKDENGIDECIRIIYVRSSETYRMLNIPQGRYYLKIAYGKDYRQKIIDDQCYVKFIKSPLYEKSVDIMDFNFVKNPNTIVGNMVYENWDVPSFEVFLDVSEIEAKGETFKSSGISEAEFNK